MRHIDIRVSDLPALTPVRVEDGHDGIVVIRNGELITAFEDSCPHAQWRLSDGEIVDGILECPGHGWEFCSDSGRCLNVPTSRLKPIAVVRIGEYARLMTGSRVSEPTGARPLSIDGAASA